MLNTNLILHLTLIEGIGPSIIQKLVQSQRSDVNASDLYHLSASDWTNYFGINDIVAAKIVAGLADMSLLEKELHLIEQGNIKLLTLLDESYPALLKEIYSPPPVLYFQGAAWAGIGKCVAIVGARKANEYGQKFVNAMVPDLVAAGYTIVSGGALGLDTMAHEAALACGGKTIAILGSGLLRPYPSANKKLFAAIVEQGGIVASSYPAMMDGLPHHFPARNRIVTGLSRGCVVVQAAQKSGALISGHCALEQGREVFAVPGAFDDELSAGCHEIIQQGAKLVMNSADILIEFGEQPIAPSSARSECASGVYRRMEDRQQSLFKPATVAKPAAIVSMYSQIQQKIITACKDPASLEDISMKTELPFELIQAELFTLQLDGVLSQDFTGMWYLQ
jgi:DNA processing protein